MAQLIKPGLMFQADPLPTPPEGLEPTMSMYHYGGNLEGCPGRGVTYVVCQDGSIQDAHDPSRPIGWELLEDENGWYYRITQMNHKPKPLAVFFRGNANPVPTGSGKIGSVVMVCRRIEEPQNAEVIEQGDDGDEVTSTPPPTPRAEPVCPGAPVKSDLAKIATLDPNLAAAAAYLNDPEQTSAMARFAEGKMSYAEMRGLCG
jgi:hypothetical protein